MKRYQNIDEKLLLSSSVKLTNIYSGLSNIQLKHKLIEKKTTPYLLPHIAVHGADFRYSIHFLKDNFKFLSDYYHKQQEAFKNIPYEDIDNKNIGYQFPSESDIDYFVKNHLKREQNEEAFRNEIVNQSNETINNAISIMLNNNQSIYLLGKVGSGKSTFLKYFEKTIISNENFKTNLIRLAYQENNDFNVFISNIDDTNMINNIAIDIAILLKKKFLQQIISFKNKHRYVNDVLDKSPRIKQIFKQLDISDMDTLWFKIESDIKSFNDNNIDLLFSFFSDVLGQENTFKTIYSIDGFDILDPAMTQKHRKFIDALIMVQNNPNNFLSTNIDIIFISTFRSCTANSCNIPFDNNAQQTYTLAPVSEKRLIERAISFIAYHHQDTFFSKSEYFFLKLLECALDAVRDYVVLEKYKSNIIRQFDYDYRMLFEYLSQIQYYGVSVYLLSNLNASRVIKKAEIDSMMIDLKIFFKTKKYYIIDILLLKNKTVYTNPYELQEMNSLKQISLVQPVKFNEANHNLKLLNNIYNYMHIGEKKSTFPLLIKYRILQILYKEAPYNYTSNDIVTETRKIGYRFSSDDFKLILEELLLSKFMKIRKVPDMNNTLHQYAISSRGELVLDLSLKSAYYQHVITYSYIPNNKYKNRIQPYTPNRSPTREALITGFKNSFIFLLLVKEIENIEEISTDLKIFPTLLNNTIEDAKHIINGFNKAYEENPDKNFKNDMALLETFFEELKQ